MNIGDNLKRIRKENKLTLEQLAEALNNKSNGEMNFNKGRISKWENGKEEPRLSSVKLIADFYGINIDSLYSSESSKLSIISIYNKLEKPRKKKVYSYAEHQLEEQNKKILYDIQGQVAAGPAIEYGDPQVESQFVEYVPASADMALTINGDSMEPDFPNGSIVFYKRQPDIENGEIAIVEINKEAVTCKKVIFDYDNKKIVLRSLNKKYDDMIYDDEQIRILGKVVK